MVRLITQCLIPNWKISIQFSIIIKNIFFTFLLSLPFISLLCPGGGGGGGGGGASGTNGRCPRAWIGGAGGGGGTTAFAFSKLLI